MNNRSHLLIAIEKWQAFKANPGSIPDSTEWKDAHASYESTLHEAGVYKEALRGKRALSEEVRTHVHDPERTFFHWAYSYASQKPEALSALHKAKSYSARMVILDGIQSAFGKAELKKEEARKAACGRRTAALIEESLKQAELSRAQKRHEEQHQCTLSANELARAIPKQATAVDRPASGKRLPKMQKAAKS